eukprot:3655601-Pyramimonas_sp.AAC.1
MKPSKLKKKTLQTQPKAAKRNPPNGCCAGAAQVNKRLVARGLEHTSKVAEMETAYRCAHKENVN